MDKALLQQLIAAFLKVNPNPSDQQFHALAFSVSIDHETLESISYNMLAEDQGQQVQAGNPMPADDGLSEQQKVLDGEYDPNTTSPNDLLLNDGAPVGTSDIQQTQDDEYDDGVGADDVGIDVSSDKDMMISDGMPALELKAATRLFAAAMQPREFDKYVQMATRMLGHPKFDGEDGYAVKKVVFEKDGHTIQMELWKNGYCVIDVDDRRRFDDTSVVKLNLFMTTQLRKLI